MQMSMDDALQMVAYRYAGQLQALGPRTRTNRAAHDEAAGNFREIMRTWWRLLKAREESDDSPLELRPNLSMI